MKDCREALIKYIILNSGNSELDLNRMMSHIRKELASESPSICVVEDAVKNLCEKNMIRGEGKKYILEDKESDRLAGVIKRREEILEKTGSEVIAKVKGRGVSSREDLQAVLRVFRDFISGFISVQSNFIMDILSCRMEVREAASPIEVLEDALNKVENLSLREPIRGSIMKALGSSSRDFVRVLYEAILNLTCLGMLSSDPSGSVWKTPALSGKTLILDTNVLFALVLPEHPQHSVTTKAISVARHLGVKYVFTKRTMLEWIEVLEKANQRFRFLNSTRHSLLGKVEDIFIRSYFKRKEDDPSLAWQEYYSEMRRINDLARGLGIQVYEENEEDVSDAEGLKIIEYLSEEVYRSGRRRLDARFIKSRSVSEHDAFHLLLVRKLREKFPSESMGPSYWFLTYDISLLEVDRDLNKFLETPLAAPSSLLMDAWALLSSLFLDDPSEEEKIVGIFDELFRGYFAASPRRLSASMVVEVLSPYLSYRSLSDEDLEAVLNNEHVKRLYFQMREARSAHPAKARVIYDKMRQRVDRIIWKLLENKAAKSRAF